MNKKQIGSLVIAAILFIMVGVSSVLTNTFSETVMKESMKELLTDSSDFNPPSEDYMFRWDTSILRLWIILII